MSKNRIIRGRGPRVAKILNLDRAKASRLKLQKRVNIDPLLQLQPRELSRGSKFKILATWGL